jgi:hypothetical protein
MPSQARLSAAPPNSPKPAGWASTIDIRALSVYGQWGLLEGRKSAPCWKQLISSACARQGCRRNERNRADALVLSGSCRLAESAAKAR